jgi:hypothetical protein
MKCIPCVILAVVVPRCWVSKDFKTVILPPEIHLQSMLVTWSKEKFSKATVAGRNSSLWTGCSSGLVLYRILA